MIAPTRRVETPQDVAQACCQVPASFWNLTSNALAKFCPRKWLVPACSALLSCIIASMQRWNRARELLLSLLGPVSTGIAIHSSAKVA